MIRSIKMLGLLATAALAIGALSAPAAQAEVTFTTGLTHNGFGEQEHLDTGLYAAQTGNDPTTNYFEFNGSKLSCLDEKVSYTGETAFGGTEPDLGLSPEYKDCGIVAEDELKTPAVVEMNGCYFTLRRPTHIGSEEYTGKVDLNCPGAGPLIKLYAAGTFTEPSILVCEVRVEPNQTELSHIVYVNTDNGEEPDEVAIMATVGGVEYTNLKKTCPGGITEAGHQRTDGKFNSQLTLGSTEEYDIWVSGK